MTMDRSRGPYALVTNKTGAVERRLGCDVSSRLRSDGLHVTPRSALGLASRRLNWWHSSAAMGHPPKWTRRAPDIAGLGPFDSSDFSPALCLSSSFCRGQQVERAVSSWFFS